MTLTEPELEDFKSKIIPAMTEVNNTGEVDVEESWRNIRQVILNTAAQCHRRRTGDVRSMDQGGDMESY